MMGYTGMPPRPASAVPSVRAPYWAAPSCHTRAAFTAPRPAVLGKMSMPPIPLTQLFSQRAHVNPAAVCAWARAVARQTNADSRSSSHPLSTIGSLASVGMLMTP